jgi:integrase
LDVEDVKLDDGIAHVLGKGRDDKEVVLLMPQTVELLRRYLRTNNITDGTLFRSNSHSQFGKRLSTRGLREIITDILRRLEINKTVHGFRHFYTTQLIKAMPGQLLDIALYTRHRSLEMLRVYDDRVRHEAGKEQFFAAFNGIEL